MHIYSKFKNKNLPYAKVGNMVFNSLYDAEGYCNKFGIDVNKYIEYDNKNIIPKIKEISKNQISLIKYFRTVIKDRIKEYTNIIDSYKKHEGKCHCLDKDYYTHKKLEYCDKRDELYHILIFLNSYSYKLSKLLNLSL